MRAKAGTDNEVALLTLLAWPRAMTDAQRVEALVSATGLDPAEAQALARLETPAMLGFHPREIAKEQARGLRRLGVPALVADLAVLHERNGQRVRAKRLLPALGAPEPMYVVEAWDRRVPNLPLKMSEVRLVVRGQVQVWREADHQPEREPRSPMDMMFPLERSIWRSVKEASGQHEDFNDAPVLKVVEQGEVIDLYRDGLVPIRIDGRKFNYDVLGGQRGLSDRVNADRLAVRLAEEATAAQVDLGFALWRPPRLTALPTAVGVRSEESAFDLYSVWRAVVEQAVREARAAKPAERGPEGG
jgi:hypothetical protein